MEWVRDLNFDCRKVWMIQAFIILRRSLQQNKKLHALVECLCLIALDTVNFQYFLFGFKFDNWENYQKLREYFQNNWKIRKIYSNSSEDLERRSDEFETLSNGFYGGAHWPKWMSGKNHFFELKFISTFWKLRQLVSLLDPSYRNGSGSQKTRLPSRTNRRRA